MLAWSDNPAWFVSPQGLVDSLHSGRNVPTVLQSLGCIAQYSVSSFESQNEDITPYINKNIIQVSFVSYITLLLICFWGVVILWTEILANFLLCFIWLWIIVRWVIWIISVQVESLNVFASCDENSGCDTICKLRVSLSNRWSLICNCDEFL